MNHDSDHAIISCRERRPSIAQRLLETSLSIEDRLQFKLDGIVKLRFPYVYSK